MKVNTLLFSNVITKHAILVKRPGFVMLHQIFYFKSKKTKHFFLFNASSVKVNET